MHQESHGKRMCAKHVVKLLIAPLPLLFILRPTNVILVPNPIGFKTWDQRILVNIPKITRAGHSFVC